MVAVAAAAGSAQAGGEYRSAELDDVAQAIDRMTLGLAGQRQEEALEVPRLRRLLVAYDGSPGARHALAWGATLAQRMGARLAVVGVAPDPEVARAVRGGAPWVGLAPAFARGDELVRRDLDRASAYLRQRGVEASVDLLAGRPAHVLVEAATTQDADLVLLGDHGHGLGERLDLGRVGTAVKHHAPCSVLVARGPPTVRRVLLATDGSQRSRLAVRLGRDVAAVLGAKATLAHVIDLASYGLSRTKAVRQGKLLAVQERMRESTAARDLDTRVAFGPPARRLRRIAADEKAGLIVVGSRGLGGLRGLALGSVSDALTRRAVPSVLAVKPQTP